MVRVYRNLDQPATAHALWMYARRPRAARMRPATWMFTRCSAASRHRYAVPTDFGLDTASAPRGLHLSPAASWSSVTNRNVQVRQELGDTGKRAALSNVAAACCVQIYTLNAQSICAQYGRICTSPVDMSDGDLSAPDRLERATVIEFIVRSGFAHMSLPTLLTVDEAADLLRTSRRAIYMMLERRQLPGVTRIGRRVLFRSADLLNWLDRKRAPSPEE